MFSTAPKCLYEYINTFKASLRFISILVIQTTDIGRGMQIQYVEWSRGRMMRMVMLLIPHELMQHKK